MPDEPSEPASEFVDGPPLLPGADHEGPGAPAAFDPVFEDGGAARYIAEGGETFRIVRGGMERVCGFVPIPLSETAVVTNIDEGAESSRRMRIEYVSPTGDRVERDVDGTTNLGAAIVASAPRLLDRLSVSSVADVALAAEQFRDPDYSQHVELGQTGWLPDGTFALPGDPRVRLGAISKLPGAALLGVPTAPDADAVTAGAAALLRVCASAPADVSMPVLAAIAGAPIFRSSDHLAARGFTVMLTGASGQGKTTLMRGMYSLLGEFRRPPECITTFRSTFAAIEPALFALRDLPVFIDNFRGHDAGARDTFRNIALAVGDGAPRATRGGGKPHSLQPKCLVVATGEHGFDDDAAVAGRIIEVPCRDVDIGQLLDVENGAGQALPHLFGAYVRRDAPASRRRETKAPLRRR
jgi:hypothetical protein